MTNITILGETSLACTLGEKYRSRGMQVTYGVSGTFQADSIAWRILLQQGNVVDYEEAISGADVVLVCCDNEQLPEICQVLKAVNGNKLVIDCTNATSEQEDKICNTEYIQKHAKVKRIFKAFNNLGIDYPNCDKLQMLKETYYCGNDDEDCKLVRKLAEIIGYRAIFAGKIQNAYLLEAMYHLSKQIKNSVSTNSDYFFKIMSV